jgi:hypothetical protein
LTTYAVFPFQAAIASLKAELAIEIELASVAAVVAGSMRRVCCLVAVVEAGLDRILCSESAQLSERAATAQTAKA